MVRRRTVCTALNEIVKMTRAAQVMRTLTVLVGVATVTELGFASTVSAQANTDARWITAWGTSQQSLGPTMITNATVRMIARVTVGGEAVRVRLDNTFGETPLVIGEAYIGPVMRGAGLTAGSNSQIRFGSSGSVTIPVGGTVTSDPIRMNVMARQDLAISLYIPETNVQPSQHSQAYVTSYLSDNGSGNVTNTQSSEPFTGTTTSTFWLKSIDVLTESATGSIVGFGDSITDGVCSTLNAHDRWQDWVAARLYLASPNAHPAMVNEGISGNTVTSEGLQPPPNSPPGLERLERDVFSHEGVTHVVLFMGTNDIRREVSAAALIAGMEEIAERIRARGLMVIGTTIIPRHNRAASGTNTGWTPEKSNIRREVNEWIRNTGSFDSVLDFDTVVRDPDDPDRIAPTFDCDGIHPNPRGYLEMGGSVPLELLTP